MAELAVWAHKAFKPSVEVLAGEVSVQVQALVLLGTTVHHVELAQLVLAGWGGVMRERTVFTLE